MTKKEIEAHLGAAGPVAYDGLCGEPIMWGRHIRDRIGEGRWEEFCAGCDRYHLGVPYCVTEGLRPGDWAVVTRFLSVAEAVRRYGRVTRLVVGPMGGKRDVVFGKRRFYFQRWWKLDDPLLRKVERVQEDGRPYKLVGMDPTLLK